MNKFKQYLIAPLLSAFFGILFSACEKEEQPYVYPSSQPEFLCQGPIYAMDSIQYIEFNSIENTFTVSNGSLVNVYTDWKYEDASYYWYINDNTDSIYMPLKTITATYNQNQYTIRIVGYHKNRYDIDYYTLYTDFFLDHKPFITYVSMYFEPNHFQ